jgi:hypothetical protein
MLSLSKHEAGSERSLFVLRQAQDEEAQGEAAFEQA